jgi:ribonucleases P/MRP protein subunit RPP40
MLHGKKGFDRLVYAAKTVLNQSLVWLFLDLHSPGLEEEVSMPLLAHHPTIHNLKQTSHTLTDTIVPAYITSFPAPNLNLSSEESQEEVYDMLEYIDLLALTSPRLQSTDSINPYLSTYHVSEASATAKPRNVRTITWTGLISVPWMLEFLCSVIKQSRVKDPNSIDSANVWLAISVSGLGRRMGRRSDGYTVLLQPEQLQSAEASTVNEVALEDIGDDAEEEVEMAEASALEAAEKSDTSNISKIGLQRFLCAEYIDTLT